MQIHELVTYSDAVADASVVGRDAYIERQRQQLTRQLIARIPPGTSYKLGPIRDTSGDAGPDIAVLRQSAIVVSDAVETVLWAVKIGEPDWQEELITATVSQDHLSRAKQWALANGFDRLRTAVFQEGDKPNFAAAVNV
jgi:hypothetical protein